MAGYYSRMTEQVLGWRPVVDRETMAARGVAETVGWFFVKSMQRWDLAVEAFDRPNVSAVRGLPTIQMAGQKNGDLGR
jgi:hypothetical protein